MTVACGCDIDEYISEQRGTTYICGLIRREIGVVQYSQVARTGLVRLCGKSPFVSPLIWLP